MKNLYKKIEQNLKKGLCVTVKKINNNYYCSILNHKDEGGNYRMSGWSVSIEESKQWIGCYCGESKEYWNEIDLEMVEVFRPEYEPFQVGDKVRILDTIKNTENWEDIKHLDMTGVINQVDFENLGTTYKINGWYIGHEFVAPLNEVKEETIKIGDHTYSKSEVEKRLQGLKEIL